MLAARWLHHPVVALAMAAGLAWAVAAVEFEASARAGCRVVHG
jgi:hypothetical protein